MTVTATLVGSQSPSLVQIVVSSAPNGEAWEVVGTAGTYSWRVPGGSGIGDGAQLVLTDNRSPGNVPITYTFTSVTVTESSAPVTVPFSRDLVLQSLDGQRALAVQALVGSLDNELPANVSLFEVPGRARPVVRYDVMGDVRSQFVLMVPIADSNTFRSLLAPGEPLVYRLGAPVMDLDMVGVIAVTRASSKAHSPQDLRLWTVAYTLVDDPFADVRLGAFSWDGAFDVAFDGLDWGDFDAAFATLAWDQFDTYDWGVLL